MLFKKYFIFFLIFLTGFILSGCSPFLPTGGGGRASSGGNGIYRSEDKGMTWQEKNNIKDSESSLKGAAVSKILFDAIDSQTLYIGTSRGLYMSEDKADSWKLLFDKSINDFELNPKTRGIIYVAGGNQLYKTSNNGQEWEPVYTETRSGASISSLAISYFDTSRIYMLISTGALLESSDWGNSWRMKYDFGKKVNELKINPDNSQNMYVSADGGLYRSVDEGENWEEILGSQEKEFPGIKNYKDLQFSEDENRLFYLCKYGILKTRDNGDTWQAVSLITPAGAVDIKAMAFNVKDDDEIYYTVDNVLYTTLDGGRNWKTSILPGVGVSQFLVDYDNSDDIYISF